MKQDEDFDLKTAIREFYAVEPLKTDLASRIADKAFANSGKVFRAEDLLSYAACVVCIVLLGYIIGFTGLKSFGPLLLFLIVVILIMAVTGWKEFRLLRRQLLALE